MKGVMMKEGKQRDVVSIRIQIGDICMDFAGPKEWVEKEIAEFKEFLTRKDK
jgi:hypothetical protein